MNESVEHLQVNQLQILRRCFQRMQQAKAEWDMLVTMALPGYNPDAILIDLDSGAVQEKPVVES